MSEIRITGTTQSVIDSLLEHIAIMDKDANIVATNRAWNKFAEDNGASDSRRYAVGANYMDICDPAAKEDEGLRKVITRLHKILNGTINSFTYEYPCHSPDEKRWFLLYATPFILENQRLGAVVSHINITRRKLAEIEAIRYAKYDSLTGVLNRRFGLEKLIREVELSDRYNHIFSICFIDIDNLKYVNDSFGHKSGDSMIKETARIIKNSLRKTDLLIRMGGDEFLIVLPNTKHRGARDVLRRIENDVSKFNANKNKNVEFSIAFSYGFAEYNPADKISSDKLIEIADKNMYVQKLNKKSRK